MLWGPKSRSPGGKNSPREEENVYLDGQLVHNDRVNQDLKDLGVQDLQSDQVQGATIITRSHGLDLQRLKNFQKNNKVIETVCPYVKKIYDRVQEANQKDYGVLVLGMKNHPEVEGILSRAREGYVVSGSQDLEKIPKNKTYVLVSQTTNRKDFLIL